MPLTERDRHDAYEALQQTFASHTEAVIELLRPDHDRLATRDRRNTTARSRTALDFGRRLDEQVPESGSLR